MTLGWETLDAPGTGSDIDSAKRQLYNTRLPHLWKYDMLVSGSGRASQNGLINTSREPAKIFFSTEFAKLVMEPFVCAEPSTIFWGIAGSSWFYLAWFHLTTLNLRGEKKPDRLCDSHSPLRHCHTRFLLLKINNSMWLCAFYKFF